MFENSSSIVKLGAKFLFVLNCIVAAFISVFIFMLSSQASIINLLIVILLVPTYILTAYVVSAFIYSFGELVENSAECKKLLKMNIQHTAYIKNDENTKYNESDPYIKNLK